MRAFFVIALSLLVPLPLVAQEAKPECNGPYKGKTYEGKRAGRPYFTVDTLKKVLERHTSWYESHSSWTDSAGLDDPRRANLCGATLWEAKLAGRNLAYATLPGADLVNVNLSGGRNGI